MSHDTDSSASDLSEKAGLPTATRSGKRVWLYPLRLGGFWAKRRLWISILLMEIYIIFPFLKWDGLPLLRFELHRDLIFVFGHIFRIQDASLLVYAILGAFALLFFTTSLMGRLWCGFACPQTVFLDWLIRPIEELFEGNANRRKVRDKNKEKPSSYWMKKIAKHGVFLAIAAILAHCLLGFFIDPFILLDWFSENPLKHPFAFFFVWVLTFFLYYDFAFFREQFCSFICPYARFQAVLIDDKTPTVTYDFTRGEPRGKSAKNNARSAKGDCIDCKLCNRVCPTGIDIREGLQLECIQCLRCVDACNLVMRNLKRPEGLIRIDSHANLSEKMGIQNPSLKSGSIRFRPILYGMLLVILGIAVTYRISERFDVAIKYTRQEGVAYSKFPDGRIANIFKFRFSNNTNEEQTIQFDLKSDGFELICGACGSKIDALGKKDVAIILVRDESQQSSMDQKVSLDFATTGQKIDLPFIAPSGSL